MTISQKTCTPVSIKTLLNLSTSKRTIMLLWNPEEITKADWFVHVSILGASFVYFSLNTPTAEYENDDSRYIGWPNTVPGRKIDA